MASTISYYIITANVVVAGNVATITPTAITTDAGAAVSGTLAGFVQAGGTVCGGGCSAPIASISVAGVITTAPVWIGASGDGLTLTVQMVPRGTNTYQSSVSAIAAVNELNDAAAAGTRVMDTDAAGSLTNIDALIDCYLVRMDLTTPPSAPATGDAYVVPTGATGAWASYVGKIAYCLNGAWLYLAPYNGLMAYNAADGAYYSYVAGAWAKKLASLDLAQTYSQPQTVTAGAATPDVLLSPSKFLASGKAVNKLCLYRQEGGAVYGFGLSQITGLDYLSGDNGHAFYIGCTSISGAGAVLAARITPAGDVGFGIADPATPLSYGTRNVAVSSAGQTNFKVLSSGQYAMMHFASGSSYATQGFAFADSTNNRVCIGTATNTPVQLNTYNTVRWEINGYDGILSPYIDNTYDVGRSDKRVRNYYGTTSSISTSWSERKTNVRTYSDAEIKCGLEILEKCPCIYQFKDAVSSKGADAARLHVGYIADTNDTISIVSAIQTAFSNNGLDPLRYGLFCRDAAKKTVTKTRTVQKQKTETKSRTVETITVTDGKAVQTTASESYEEPVYETLAVVDADGTAVYNTAMITADDGTQTETKVARTYQNPVMVDAVEEYTEQVDDTNDDGSVKYAYSLRYSELHDFVITALYQAHAKLAASVATLVAAAAAATSTTTTSTTDTSSTSSTTTTS